MKKKFIKVVLFGALTLAAGATVTSCKGYDDDVKNLQEQIDKIASTSPVSTEDMKAAVDAAKNELQGKVTALETALQSKDQAIKTLETEIKSLKEALTKGEGVNVVELAKKLATTENELKTLIKSNDDTVKQLQQSVLKLQTMSKTLDDLVKAQEKYIASGGTDVSGFANTSFDKFINQSIADALETDGEIVAYVKEAVEDAIVADAKILNNHIATLAGINCASLTDFVDKVYNDIYKEGGAIRVKLDALDELLAAIDAYVGTGEGKYADYAAIIAQIENSRLQLAALQLPANQSITQIVQNIISNELKNAQSELGTLTSKLSNEIKALKGMIQSIMYVPASADRTVEFNTLYAQPTTEWIPVVSVNQVEAVFRVSPLSAVAELLKGEKGKYKIATDYQVLTRATGDFFTISNIEAVTGEPNLIKVTLDAGKAVKSYAISLTVEDKDADTKLNDISSDYFAAVKVDRYIQGVTYQEKDPKTTLINDDSNSQIDYLTGGEYRIKTTSDQGGLNDIKTQTPAEMQIPVSPFSVKFVMETGVDNGLFTFTNGVLKVKTTGDAANLGKQCTVSSIAKVTISEGVGKSYTKTLYSPVTIISEIKNYTLATNYAVTWDGANKNYKLVLIDKAAILKLCGLSDFSSIAGVSVVADDVAGLTIAKTADNANLELTVPAGTAPVENAALTITIKVSNILTVEVKGKLTISYPEIAKYSLTNNALVWDGLSTPVSYTFEKNTSNKVESVTITRKLAELFTNYSVVKAGAGTIGATFKIESDNKTATISNDILTVKDYDGKSINVTFKVLCGEHELTSKTVSVTIPVALNGTFALAVDADDKDKDMAKIEKTDVSTITDRNKPITLTGNLSWKDVAGKVMWPTVDATHFAGAAADALNLYGFKVEYAFVNTVDGTNFALDKGKGTLAMKSTLARLSQVMNDIVVKVKVIPKSPWGDMSSKAVILTVTVSKWQDTTVAP